MLREACVCDHGFERSDLCAEIIIIIIIIQPTHQPTSKPCTAVTNTGYKYRYTRTVQAVQHWFIRAFFFLRYKNRDETCTRVLLYT